MKKILAILFVCLPVLAGDTALLYPPGYKPALQSPKASGEMKNAPMLRTASAVTLPLAPVELRLTHWTVFNGVRVPQPAIHFRTNAPRCTVFSQTDNGWSCWTTITNCVAGETRNVGWCPTGRDYALWRVVLHD